MAVPAGGGVVGTARAGTGVGGINDGAAAAGGDSTVRVLTSPSRTASSASMEPFVPRRFSGDVTVRVFILDDHEIVRIGLGRMIEDNDVLVRVGEASSGAEALDRIPAARPHVAV